jgi:glyoxylase-like metal-dependent hydrolase (beta-lactamase superfamily II)
MLERLLSAPRTLGGDSLSKTPGRRPNVEGIGDRRMLKGRNGKTLELHHVPNQHSDGMLVVHLPAEKVLWSADITVTNPNPNQLEVLRSLVQTIDRLQLDFETFIPAHPPNPERALTKADVRDAVKTGTD